MTVAVEVPEAILDLHQMQDLQSHLTGHNFSEFLQLQTRMLEQLQMFHQAQSQMQDQPLHQLQSQMQVLPLQLLHQLLLDQLLHQLLLDQHPHHLLDQMFKFNKMLKQIL